MKCNTTFIIARLNDFKSTKSSQVVFSPLINAAEDNYEPVRIVLQELNGPEELLRDYVLCYMLSFNFNYANIYIVKLRLKMIRICGNIP